MKPRSSRAHVELAMKLLKTVSFIALCVASVVVAVGLVLPTTWHVERSIVVAAEPARVHAYVAAPRSWPLWYPWNEASAPDARWSYGGPPAGEGAWMAWSGETIGRGSLRISWSVPDEGVRFDEMIDAPQPNAHGAILFHRLEIDGAVATRVTWTDDGQLPAVIGAYLRPVREDVMGGFFEQGLRNLKARVEADLEALRGRARDVRASREHPAR